MSIQLLFKQATGNIPEDKFWVGFVVRFWDKEGSKSVPRCRAVEITSLGLGLALERRKRDGFSFPLPLQHKNRQDKKVVGRFYVAIDDPQRVFTDCHFIESVDFVFAGKNGLKLAELGGPTSVTVFNPGYKGGELTFELFKGHEAAGGLRFSLIACDDGVRKFCPAGSILDIDGYPGDIEIYCHKHAALLDNLNNTADTPVPPAHQSPPSQPSFATPAPATLNPSRATLSVLRGGNVPLTEIAPEIKQISLQLGWSSSNPEMELDASAFMLNEAGKVRGEEDFIFFGNLASACSSVTLVKEGELPPSQKACLQIDLARVPTHVDKLVVCVTIYDAETRGQNFSSVQSAFIAVADAGSGDVLCRFDLVDHYSDEASMIFGEIYRHKVNWKFRAVGQGYRDGLAAMCTRYGVVVVT